MDRQNYIERFIRAQLLCFYALGVLYVSTLLGFINLTVQGIEITPSQAETIQDLSEYSTERITPPRKRK